MIKKCEKLCWDTNQFGKPPSVRRLICGAHADGALHMRVAYSVLIDSTLYPPAFLSRMYRMPKTMMIMMENGAT